MSAPHVFFRPLSELSSANPVFSVIAARHEGQWIFCRHRQRATWEIPGGHIEEGETALDAAARELREETGAQAFTLTPVCVYGVSRAGTARCGLLCFAEIESLGPLDPAMEIAEIRRFPALPDALTYPDIQPALYEQIQGWLNLQSSPDEIWDVYDAQRRPTGRMHRRGDMMPAGDYHLCVHVFVRRPSGEYLITQRAPTKGFPLMWEITGGSAAAGEDSITAALREVKEETGLLALPAQAQIIHQETGDAYHLDVYLLTLDFEPGDVTLQPGETVDKRLVTREALLALAQSGELVSYRYLDTIKRAL